MPSAPITNVSDTARWVAVYRAMETERPDAIFRDPFARKLAGERGEEIVRSMRRARSAAWAMIVRTAVMDEVITSTLATGGIDMIIISPPDSTHGRGACRCHRHCTGSMSISRKFWITRRVASRRNRSAIMKQCMRISLTQKCDASCSLGWHPNAIARSSFRKDS
jgi:hypothetical protein